MTKTARNMTALLGLMLLTAGAVFMGCSGEDISITDPNGQIQDNNYGTNGFSFGDDPIQSDDGGATDDGNVLPTNIDQGEDAIDTLTIIEGQNGETT